MKIGKRIVLYLVTVLCVIFAILLFIKFFTFDKKLEALEISEEDVMSVYSLVPDYYTYSSTFYSSLDYLAINNVSSDGIVQMTYRYLVKNDEFSFETINDTDKEKFESLELINKIKKSTFDNTVNKLFNEPHYTINKDVKVDSDKSLRYEENGEYLYIYKNKNEVPSNIKVYKGLYSYTLEDSNNVLKIKEYYLICNTESKECFNNESMSSKSSITYREDLDVIEVMDRLTKFEHEFKYIDGNFKYTSTSK